MNTYLRKKNTVWQKFAIGGICLILLIAILNIFQSPIKNTFYYITSPFSKALWQAGNGAGGFFAPLFNAGGLAQENSNLKQENQDLLGQVVLLQNTIEQSQSIQSAIQNTQGGGFKMVLAQSMGLDGTNGFLLVDKGLNDGIQPNMPVVSDTKVLYGKVFKVYKNFSQVMLISNKTSVVDAQVLSALPVQPAAASVTGATAASTSLVPTPIYGAIKGSGDLSLYLDLVPSTDKISQGDALVTSGQEGIFPGGLLIGNIVSVNENDQKPFQTAKIQPLGDPENASDVFIITNYKEIK